jgi:hypothetical protein
MPTAVSGFLRERLKTLIEDQLNTHFRPSIAATRFWDGIEISSARWEHHATTCGGACNQHSI